MFKRFKVLFNRDKCKGCELCVNFCPMKIIEMDKTSVNSKGYHPASIDEDNMECCVGCSSCALMCPDCCISIYQLEEGEE